EALAFFGILADRAIEREFAHLDIPVTEFMPGELVEHIGVIVEPVGVDRLSSRIDARRKTRANPTVHDIQVATRENSSIALLHRGAFPQIHKNKPRRVPELVYEILITGDAILGQFNIA